MTDLLTFRDQVVLVTGASRGLGQAYAELFRSRAAILVENDIDADGAHSADAPPGIQPGSRYLTGSAVDGGALVETVVKQYGRIDALVLNAGFLRDKSFAKADEADFLDLLDIHLVGPWRAAKAAWPHMVSNGFGRIVFTTSPAALYGGFGQSGYAAAKSALLGLTRTLAIEGERHGITVNCIAPLAASRLSDGVLPPEVAERLPPQSIAGLVAWLCHPQCRETGQIYEAAGGSIARHAPFRNEGVYLGSAPSPEDVRDHWRTLHEMERTESPASTVDAISRFIIRWPHTAKPGATP